jgi:hypothetical protein
LPDLIQDILTPSCLNDVANRLFGVDGPSESLFLFGPDIVFLLCVARVFGVEEMKSRDIS